MEREPIWLILLAAGLSRRMGAPKLLLPVGAESMVRYTVRRSLRTEADGLVVVFNSQFPKLFEEIADLPVAALSNPSSERGMSSSLQLGIRYIQERDAAAAIILLADQPGFEPSMVNTLISEFRETDAAIVQAKYSGHPSHPVLFARSMFAELLAIEGDKGARDVLKRHAADIHWMESAGQLPMDIDTPEDYRLYLDRVNGTATE